jgi:ABC-type polysaccharide/polyol phosphate export permease
MELSTEPLGREPIHPRERGPYNAAAVEREPVRRKLLNPQYVRALADLYEGGANWRLWTRLGWMEIRRRYRRTMLGPFWTSFNVAVMVFTMGFLWAALFNQPVSRYMPYLTAGIIVWQLLSSCMNEGATVFTSNSGLLTTIRIPQSLLVGSMVCRNVIVFFHNLMIFLVVMLLWQVPVTWATPLFVPGLIIVSLNACWIAVVLALLGTRFRDVPQFLGGFITILMFLTPIMWSRDAVSHKTAIGHIIDINPFYHLVEIVRGPLLGEAPSLLSWGMSIALVPIGFALALSLFSRFRQRVTYWL